MLGWARGFSPANSCRFLGHLSSFHAGFLVPNMFAISKNTAISCDFPRLYIACQKSLRRGMEGFTPQAEHGGTNINHSGELHPNFSRTFYTPKLYLRNAEEIILRKYMIIHVKVHSPISVFPPMRTEHHMVDFWRQMCYSSTMFAHSTTIFHADIRPLLVKTHFCWLIIPTFGLVKPDLCWLHP